MMIISVYPGAPWLGDHFKDRDCKDQIWELVGSQELAEAKKLNNVLGALTEKT